ncbi:serine protease, partial [Lobosporangium transversale]
MLFRLSTVAAIALTASSAVVAFPSFLYSERMAPVVSSIEAEVVPDSYIVVFKDGVRNLNEQATWIQDLHRRDVALNGAWENSFDGSLESGVRHIYNMDSFQGIAGRFRPEVIEYVRRHRDTCCARDQTFFIYESVSLGNAPWGLARISHRKKLTLKTYKKYEHNPEGGDGITVFVIDTGINTKHKEFEGRASWGATIPMGDADIDGNGHGTHCAGTIGSAAYGVAKKAKVVAVKVLRSNGSGTMSDVVAGVDFAVQKHSALKTAGGSKYKGSVANMSLGGGKSRPLDSAVSSAVARGLHFAVAAGNDNRDACNYSPAGVEAAVTVGAST